MRTALSFAVACVAALSGCSPAPKPESCPLIATGVAISSDGMPIHYTAAGDGDPALVFIHGWSCDRTYWSNQVPFFAKRQLVVTIDLAGHGESGAGRMEWTMEAFGEDVAAVAHALQLSNIILVAHSMGGAVMIEAARLLPGEVRGLVAVDTLHDVEEIVTEAELQRAIAPLQQDFVAGTRAFVTAMFPPDADPSLVARIAEDMSSAPPDIALNAMAHLFRYNAAHALKSVRAPIRAIVCPLYPVNTAAALRHSNSFRHRVIPNCGHFLMLERPDEFNRELEAVLREFQDSTPPRKPST